MAELVLTTFRYPGLLEMKPPDYVTNWHNNSTLNMAMGYCFTYQNTEPEMYSQVSQGPVCTNALVH